MNCWWCLTRYYSIGRLRCLRCAVQWARMTPRQQREELDRLSSEWAPEWKLYWGSGWGAE